MIGVVTRGLGKSPRLARAIASASKKNMSEILIGRLSDFPENGMVERSTGEKEDAPKVLISNFGGQLYATSPKCTHYGAPLIKGVLSPGRGTVTCPWHGACFNLKTGDIEDAPALDAIYSFPLRVDGQDVYITAKQEDLKSGHRAPSFATKSASGTDRVVIIGGGSAATTCSEGLREYGYTGNITVLSSEPYLPIDRTKLSKALIADPQKVALRDADFYKGLDIDFRKGTTVTAVDTKAKQVTLEHGGTLDYTKLVIAVGGSPRRLPLPGFDLSNVFVLRTIEHTKKIAAARDVGEKKRKNIVIIGSSFIGMEAAHATAKDHDVTVIGMDKIPLANVLGDKIGQALRKNAESAGVKFYMEAGVEKALASDVDPTKAIAVLLKDGTSVPADFIILGTGVAPATKFLIGSGIQTEKDGGIKVDEFLQVSGAEDVFAVGDIAYFPYTGPGAESKSLRIEHWDVAANHGRTVARNLSGKPTKFTNIPYFWSAQGKQIRYCGNNSPAVGYDDIVYQGSLDELKFAAFYCKGDEVVAVASMGPEMDPIVSKSSELLKIRAMPSKKQLAEGLDVRQMDLSKV